ncbi:hypothetical protein WH47_12207 [Habropoda laboriosa]|uniref:Uncharacterized protein n=1 Tax=Habropoda laboriosa TaxID=597456 RepID=A0A0L7RAF9_9HYME|nr:hypothetical protein WH47_12207 [Habropoda laboriosa]
MPLRREDQDPEPNSDVWQTNRSFRPNPFFNRSPYTDLYNRASRSRGTPALDRPEQASERENPFTTGRNLNFDVAPAQSPPLHGLKAPQNPYQPRFPIARSPARSPFINPSFYDMTERQSDIEPSNGYLNPHLSRSTPYGDLKDPKEDSKVMYRAEKYRDDTFDERSFVVPAEQYPRWKIPYERDPIGAQMHDFEQFPQATRHQPEESRITYEPEIKYNSYKQPADQNVFRMIQNIGKQVVNSSNRQRIQEQRRQEAENNSPRVNENGGQMKVKMAMKFNEGGQSEHHFHSHEGEEEEDAVSKRNTMGVNSSSRDKSLGETSTQSEYVENIEPGREPSPVYAVRPTTEHAIMA